MAHILLVDDDTNVLLTMAIALRRQGHSVTIAQSGVQALNILNQQEFTFLISDVKMPGMTGLELAERAHSLDHPPTIILTSAQDVEIKRGIADAFIPKPVDVTELQRFLQQAPAHGGSYLLESVNRHLSDAPVSH